MAAGLKAVLKESIGHTLLSISPLGTKEMGWTSVTWVYLPVKVQVSVQQLYISTTRTL